MGVPLMVDVRAVLGVSGRIVEDIIAHAAGTHPREACGLLLGTADRIDQATLCTNIHPTPLTHFEIDPAALIAAHKVARAGGPQIVGYWHSHPTGTAAPSVADQTNASGDGRIWAIVGAREVTFWRDAPGGFEPLSTQAVAG